MKKDLEAEFHMCSQCRENKRSKLQTKKVAPHDFYSYGVGDYFSLDHFEFNRHKFLLAVDRVSSFILCNEVRNTETSKVIRSLMSWFSITGLPVVIHSDGGRGFESNEFKDFAKKYGIAWQVSAAFLPAHNGQVERGVQTVKNVLKRKGDLINLQACLIQMNAMQRGNDGGSPAEMFLGRPSRNMLPGSRKMPRQ